MGRSSCGSSTVDEGHNAQPPSADVSLLTHRGGLGGPKLGEASGRAHLEAGSSDWWADCVEVELAGPSRSSPSSDKEHSDHARTPSRVPSPPVALSPTGAAAAVAPAPVSPSGISQCLQSQLCSAITDPILIEPPRLRVPRRRRAVECTFSPPRRSGRLAAKSRCRASNPTVQAQNVLMAKLGLRQQDQAP